MKLVATSLILAFSSTFPAGTVRAQAGEELQGKNKAAILPRCQVVPLPHHQVSFRIDGVEKTRWHFGEDSPRPFFFPFRGPSGADLTRMGHPGAPNHDHHRSIWFAHNKVNGIDFWGDKSRIEDQAIVRQAQWYVYQDGKEEAVMASALLWLDKERNALMKQDLVAAIRPLPNDEHLLELQLTLTPADSLKKVELGKTNFGVLAIRVAKSISGHFGDGTITNDQDLEGEKQLFGKPARWIDYSGPVASEKGKNRIITNEGITCFDHPKNSEDEVPASWHIREDGWMGPSICRDGPRAVSAEKPLVLRYLLHAHAGAYASDEAKRIYQDFLERPGFRISKSTKPHHQFQVQRVAAEEKE